MTAFPARRRQSAAVIMVGVLALIGAAGCTAAEPAGTADYPAYSSSAELISKADLVVRGVALSSRPGELLPDPITGSDPQANPQAGRPTRNPDTAPNPDASTNPDASANPNADGAQDDDAVSVTITTLRIDEVFKGPGTPGDLIEVSQLGNDRDGTRDEGTTLLSPTAKSGYVLFLASYGPGRPHDLLNPDALYTVADGGALTPVGPGTPPLATVDELRARS